MSSDLGAQVDSSAIEKVSGKGLLVVVSSPSGGGKGTLIRRALEIVPGLGYSVSFTTRPPREGEMNGRDYWFVSLETFVSMIEQGSFLEWAIVHGNHYGTSRDQVALELAMGHDIVLEIDVQGAAAVRALNVNTVGIFILPPSFEVLKQRLIDRRSNVVQDVELRLKNARGEVEHYSAFDYLIINDDAEAAGEQLASIVTAERSRTKRNHDCAERIIRTFPPG